MVANWTGSHIGRDGRKGAGLSVLVVAVGCICVAAGVARAQTCPSTPCSTGADCDDGSFCTVDICINPGPSGQCICAQRSCDDNLFCTIDSCNETTNACEHAARTCQAPTPYCDDGLDSCVQCLLDSQCTTPPRLHCGPSGTCVECLSDAECQDGLVCNGVESCNLSTGLCQAGTPLSCPKKCFRGTAPPGTTCTTDSNCGTGGKCLGFCSELRGVCVQCDHDAGYANGGCDDGTFCNGEEACQNDQCVAGTPPTCKTCVGGSENGQPCSTSADCPGSPPGTCTGVRYCDEASDRCVQCLSSSHCEDFNFCTSNACLPSPFNTCDFSLDPTICSDGLSCNGQEVCNYVLGNSCSLPSPSGSDAAHCCFRGVCSVPKSCTTNANCPSGDFCSFGLCSPHGCNTNADCPLGTGTCDNETATICNADHSVCSVDCSDEFSCTVDSCNEATDSCLNIPSGASCSDSLGCNGTETCEPGTLGADPASGCKDGTSVDCSAVGGDPECSAGGCVEQPSVHCVAQPIRQGLKCDDENPCTALSKCNNGLCVNDPPAPNDPFRCVKLEWRPPTVAPVLAGSTVELGLYAVASGCNTPTTGCPGFSLELLSVDALFSWNKTFLQLKPSTEPDPNPAPSCTAACDSCPINTYNWAGSGGAAFWPNDCSETGDHLNEPCTGGVPANDGNARYLGFRGANPCPDPCATTAGLKVTTIKFQAISGGTSQIALIPCFGAASKTAVQSPIPNPLTSDVTKSLGPAVTITVTCDDVTDCNDNNACTNDSCSCNTPGCSGTCQHVPNTNTCDDGLFCTTNDRCSSGQCVGDATTCKTCLGGHNDGEPCYFAAQCETPGTCTGGPSYCQETNDRCVECLSAANCNDGVGNTVDTCVKTCSGGDNINEVCTVVGDCPGLGGACETDFCENTPIDCNDNVACTVDVSDPVTGTCTNTPNNAFCNPTNSFCSAAICDPVDDCVFDHECISANGNPCPNPTTCNETTDTCGGCMQPTAVGIAGRYLAVTPADQGSTPLALVVMGDCGDPNGACVYRYIQSKCNGGPNNGVNCFTDADCPKTCAGGLYPGRPCTTDDDCPIGTCAGRCDAGRLGSTPFYKTASQWGTAKVRGAQIRPGADYLVEAQCSFPGVVLSAAATARTFKWGDVDGDGDVDGIDITRLVNAFKGAFGSVTFEQVNLWPCTPDGVIDALDITLDVDAFKGLAFPCARVCP